MLRVSKSQERGYQVKQGTVTQARRVVSLMDDLREAGFTASITPAALQMLGLSHRDAARVTAPVSVAPLRRGRNTNIPDTSPQARGLTQFARRGYMLCSVCGSRIPEGTLIVWYRVTRTAHHADCKPP